MNNFNIKSLVLTALVVMVYGASIKSPHKNLLGHIYDDAESLHARKLNLTVPRLPGLCNGDCVKEIFCFAEKALEKTTLVNSSLTRHLKKYNEHKNITCDPQFEGTCYLKKLLETIEKCAKQ